MLRSQRFRSKNFSIQDDFVFEGGSQIRAMRQGQGKKMGTRKRNFLIFEYFLRPKKNQWKIYLKIYKKLYQFNRLCEVPKEIFSGLLNPQKMMIFSCLDR